LSSRERGRLLAAVALGQWENALGRAKLTLGRLPARAANVDLDTFSVPDSAFAREAERACDELPAALVSHSYRTWLFGRALAAVDGIALDLELFYCGSLLHDHGIAQPTPGRDFTLASADRTLACAAAAGVSDERKQTQCACRFPALDVLSIPTIEGGEMIVVVGRVRTDPDKRDALVRVGQAVAAASRVEPGCISYRLYEDTEIENEFVFLEEWDSDEVLQRHFTTSHIREFLEAIPATIVAPPDVKFHTVASSMDLADVSPGR
jgi:quinol monooxygenase YgiN